MLLSTYTMWSQYSWMLGDGQQSHGQVQRRKEREKGRGRSGVVQYYLLGPMLKIMEEREREQGFPQNEKPSRVLNDIHEH